MPWHVRLYVFCAHVCTGFAILPRTARARGVGPGNLHNTPCPRFTGRTLKRRIRHVQKCDTFANLPNEIMKSLTTDPKFRGVPPRLLTPYPCMASVFLGRQESRLNQFGVPATTPFRYGPTCPRPAQVSCSGLTLGIQIPSGRYRARIFLMVPTRGRTASLIPRRPASGSTTPHLLGKTGFHTLIYPFKDERSCLG